MVRLLFLCTCGEVFVIPCFLVDYVPCVLLLLLGRFNPRNFTSVDDAMAGISRSPTLDEEKLYTTVEGSHINVRSRY